jgi:hypothetical protein
MHRRSYWIPGAYAPVLSEKCNSFSGLLKNKGSKEERKTKVGLDAIDKSTPLESNKSLFHMLSRNEPYRELGANYFDERRRHYTVDRLLSRIEHLGYRVHLEPVAVPAT